jgi:hypothetical protein
MGCRGSGSVEIGVDQLDKTYTYTARNIENPEQVVTFTLRNRHMSVGSGAPLEQLETALRQARASDEEQAPETRERLWLKPVAVSLLERGVGPFQVLDVKAAVAENRLRVRAWYRAGGLALAPITLVDGPVDNPQAAKAFVGELEKRKTELKGRLGFLRVLDYWLTWLVAGLLAFSLFQLWRGRAAKS